MDLIVIGAGVAGLTAAKAAAERGLKVACIESMMPGGLIININELDPALPGRTHAGCDLAAELMTEAMEAGVASIADVVTGVKRDDAALTDVALTVVCVGGENRANAVIIATGASLKPLGIPGEAEFENRGVAHCADCDGPMYRGKEAVVIGGGDSALQEALVLSGYCNRVHLIYRKSAPSANARLIEAVTQRSNIARRPGTIVEKISGDGAGVTGVVVRSAGANAAQTIPCHGVFAYVGLAANIGFLPPEIARDASGRITTDAQFKTSMPGVIAAGAVRAGCGGLIADAADEGARAAASV